MHVCWLRSSLDHDRARRAGVEMVTVAVPAAVDFVSSTHLNICASREKHIECFYIIVDSSKHTIQQIVHPNRNWNWLFSCDSSYQLIAHPNNGIDIPGYFQCPSALVFQANSIPQPEYLHPNIAL
jgi:hypothetical protein